MHSTAHDDRDGGVSTDLATLPPLVLARHTTGPGIAEIAAGQHARRLPYRATAAVAAAGAAAHGLADAAAALDHPAAAGGIVLGTWAASAVAVPVMRMWWRQSIPDVWRRRWWAASLFGAGWVSTAAAVGPVGPHGEMLAALAVGAAGLSAQWMRAHPVQFLAEPVEEPALEPEPEPEPVRPSLLPKLPMDPASVAERRWYERVAPYEGPAIVAGGELTQREDLSNATRWLGETPPGSTTFDNVFAQRARIAHALQVAIDDVLIEPVPGDESRFWFTLVTSDDLAAGVDYPGPEYRDGLVRIGRRAGSGEDVNWVAWQKGQGVRGGAALGQMGSGKTALLELVMLGLRSSGCWRVWWGDGDPQGSSSNLAEDAADWFECAPEGLLRQLSAFEKVVDTRGDLKHLLTEDPDTDEPIPRTHRSQRELREFKPCADYPGYMWFLPELGTLLSNEELMAEDFCGRLFRVLRRARKFGLAAAIDTQSGVDRDFGNNGVLKGFLTKDNAFCGRSTNSSEQYMVGTLAVSPGRLPADGGYFYAIHDGALARFRTAWVRNLHDYLPGLPVCRDDPDSADAIRPYLPTRDPEASLEESRARMEARRAAARGEASVPTAATASTKPVSTAPPRWAAAGGATFGDPAMVGAPVAQLADYRPPQRRAVAPLAAFGALPDRPERILAVLRSEQRPWRTRELAEATELPLSAVSTALTQHLVPRGLAHSPDGVQGRYTAGPAND